MEEYLYPDKEFCKDSRCVHYNLIGRLTSMQDSTQENDIAIARVQCQQRCERTAYQFNQWLTGKIKSL